jgi:hypothetical protein
MPYVIDSVTVYFHKLPRTDGSARDESLNLGKMLGLPFRACDMDSVAQSNWHSRKAVAATQGETMHKQRGGTVTVRAHGGQVPVKIIGIEGLTTDQIHREIANGGKFVFYQYCVSAFLVTFKRTSNIYFLRGGQHSAVHGLPFTLISLVAGWWGIPWGPIYTVQSVWTNITGGRDVTPEMLAQQTSSPPMSV